MHSFPTDWMECSWAFQTGPYCHLDFYCGGDIYASGGDHSQQGCSRVLPEMWAHDPKIMYSRAPKQLAGYLKPDTSPRSAPSPCSQGNEVFQGTTGGGVQHHLYYILPHILTYHHHPLPFPALLQYLTPDINLHFKTKTEPHVPYPADINNFLWWALTLLTTGEALSQPYLNFSTLYPNWQAVFLFCNAKQVFAMCFSGIWL